MSGATRKSHHTAVAAIPPPECWEPIQAIRRVHDRQIGRWMPHVNLLYPFVMPDRLEASLPLLTEACAAIVPFGVTLGQFRSFQHPSGRATIWLAPEPAEKFVRLQRVLQERFLECDDLTKLAVGFTPHLSVGRAKSADAAGRLRDELQASWQPLRFELAAIAVIQRGPDSPFQVMRWVPLAAK
jgi:RNA 2',3'-cyclic 3'-phosphodiesterase